MISSQPHYSLSNFVQPSSTGPSPVGLASHESKSSSFKPIEQLSGANHTQTKQRFTPSESSNNSEKTPVDDTSKQRESALEKNLERRKQEEYREEIVQLAARDREVRAHEQAHVAAGGQYAGGPQYQYDRGPDGVSYAVAGEVSIDISRASTPEQTITKAQTVKRAALAPAEPSSQDLRVAAQATLLESDARQELAGNRLEEASNKENSKEPEQSESNSLEKDNKIAAESTNIASPQVVGSEYKSDETSFKLQSRVINNQLSHPLSIQSRLISGIANTNISSQNLGSLLDQLA